MKSWQPNLANPFYQMVTTLKNLKLTYQKFKGRVGDKSQVVPKQVAQVLLHECNIPYYLQDWIILQNLQFSLQLVQNIKEKKIFSNEVWLIYLLGMPFPCTLRYLLHNAVHFREMFLFSFSLFGSAGHYQQQYQTYM